MKYRDGGRKSFESPKRIAVSAISGRNLPAGPRPHAQTKSPHYVVHKFRHCWIRTSFQPPRKQPVAGVLALVLILKGNERRLKTRRRSKDDPIQQYNFGNSLTQLAPQFDRNPPSVRQGHWNNLLCATGFHDCEGVLDQFRSSKISRRRLGSPVSTPVQRQHA